MRCTGWLGAMVVLGLALSPASAADRTGLKLARLNRQLHGTIVDYSYHHGADRRIWSPALCQHRCLSVYLPPCFDPRKSYPVMLWLHGFLQDEDSFLEYIVVHFDRAMACGQLPPMIIAAPDGTICGRVSIRQGNSFFLNSKAGNFEDYIIEDIWGFLVQNFPIRPEREAHVLAGLSMGGFASFNQAMKHPEMFKVAVGIFPPLNLRWVDCHCRYMSNFDPCCWGWRNSVERGCEVLGRFYGVILVPLKLLLDPVIDRGPGAIEFLSRENPTEMIDRLGVTDGLFDLYVAYGGRDEFNIDAQVESFLYLARDRGVTVTVDYAPRGHHDMETAIRSLPGIIHWLAPRIAPYAP